GKLDPNISRFVDWDLFLRFTELETPIALPCILSHYLRDRDSQSVTVINSGRENLDKIHQKMKTRSSYSVSIEDGDITNELFGLSSKILDIRRANKWNSAT